MNYVERIEHWGEAHHPKWLDFVRIALGIFLLLKGVEFADNMNKLLNLMSGLPFGNFMMIMVAHYVLAAYMLGGVLLATGLLTRFACIINLPVVLAALFMNVFHQFSEETAVVVILVLLVYFLVIGSGRWSLDWYVNKEYERRMHHERDFY
ncbi:MAG TPA: DoxX family protein [Flavisolibacter sp.]